MTESVAPAAPDQTSPPVAAAGESEARSAGSTAKRAGWTLVRAAVTLGAFVWLFSIVSISSLLEALRRAHWQAMALAVTLQVAALVFAAVRWGLLLAAYGAKHRPRLTTLFRLHWIGYFYNTYVPGGVGGDVVRAIATKRAFGERASSGAVTIVLIERVLGLSGLITLAGLALWVRPLPGLENVWVYALLTLLAAAGAIGGVAVARLLAPRLPGPLSHIAATLPRLARPWPFVASVLLSVATHLLIATTGHALVEELAPQVTFADSAVMIPLSQAGIYLPTVAGLGAADAAMVYLYGLIHVPATDVFAASLLMLASRLLAAAGGGVWSLFSSGLKVDDDKTAG